MNEMFNRYASGVRAHADGVGVKQHCVRTNTIVRFGPLNDHNLASDCRGDSLASASTAAFKIATSKGRVRLT